MFVSIRGPFDKQTVPEYNATVTEYFPVKTSLSDTVLNAEAGDKASESGRSLLVTKAESDKTVTFIL